MLNKKFIISPPFGNYITRDWAYSVKGSFTVTARHGLFMSTLKTFRKYPGGWINQIGLKNKGIYNIEYDDESIYSFAPLKKEDYINFLAQPAKHIELNISCPNAKVNHINQLILKMMVDKFETVIIKMPSERRQFNNVLDATSECGVQYYHMCNTFPTERGGVSGSSLKNVSLRRIYQIKKLRSDIKVIGGGGIYNKQDVIDYYNAGADIFSLSTVWFTPWRIKSIIS